MSENEGKEQIPGTNERLAGYLRQDRAIGEDLRDLNKRKKQDKAVLKYILDAMKYAEERKSIRASLRDEALQAGQLQLDLGLPKSDFTLAELIRRRVESVEKLHGLEAAMLAKHATLQEYVEARAELQGEISSINSELREAAEY